MPHTYRCTDCGKELGKPGTCADCIRAHEKAERKIRDDLARKRGKGKKGGRK